MPVYVPGDTTTVVVDQDADKDWVWDFASKTNGTGPKDWLSSGDSVASLTFTPPAEITAGVKTIINTNTAVRQWFSFAGCTADTDYVVEAHLVTADGREDDFPITFHVIEY